MAARVRHSTRRRSTGGGIGGLARRIADARGPRVKVGLPVGSAPYPDGTSVILVGAVNEFGTNDGHIPARPWLSTAITQNRRDINRFRGQLAARITSGDLSIERALGLLGEYVSSLTKQNIIAIDRPPNAPSTIRQKRGKSNPLINTGHLLESVTYRVIL